MSYNSKCCEAQQYKDCSGCNEKLDVTFKYCDFKGHVQPDELVSTILCKTHANWLRNFYQWKPLEMRGDSVEHALHNDLFQPFFDVSTIFTLVHEDSFIGDERKEQFYLINGRDVIKFRELLIAEDPSKKKMWIGDSGFFQIAVHQQDDLLADAVYADTVYADSVYADTVYADAIIEVVNIRGELELESIVNTLVGFYKPAPYGELHHISPGALKWIPRDKKNPTIKTEYTIEPIPAFIRSHFITKQKEEKYNEFEGCCEFIESLVDRNIIKWDEIRANSPHTELELYEAFRELTNALLNKDAAVCDSTIYNMLDNGDISDDVLFVTYIYANHQLYASRDPKKMLYQNTKLIDLFIYNGIEKALLALAIAGERLRYLSRAERDSHDVLDTNEFVVEYLVPKYVYGHEIIYKSDSVTLTALEYWEYFNNTTTYFRGGYGDMRENVDIFEKSPTIYAHLLKHTPAVIIAKIKNTGEIGDIVEPEPAVAEPEPAEHEPATHEPEPAAPADIIEPEPAPEPAAPEPAAPEPAAPEPAAPAVAKPPVGCLDVSLLPKNVLDVYNKNVVENGQSEADFIILGFPSLFEYLYTDMVDGTKKTMAFTESVFPGVTEMYERKKRDLRKNDYKAWKFVNKSLPHTLSKKKIKIY
jgi:hypothetical protein